MLQAFINKVIFISFGILILVYSMSDKLKFFVNTKYSTTIVSAWYIIIGLGIVVLYYSWKKTHATYCNSDTWNCDHDNHPWYRYVLILFPLLCAICVSPKTLSSQAIYSRGITTEIAISKPTHTRAVQFGYKSENFGLIDWIRMINANPEPSAIVGKKVRVEWMIYQDNESGNFGYNIVNFLVTCCVADAQPVGLPIIFDPTQITIRENVWAKIEGSMEEISADGDRIIGIKVQNIEFISTPSEPYVY